MKNTQGNLGLYSKQFETLLTPIYAEYKHCQCYSGLIFNQGKRTWVQLNIPAQDIPNLLQVVPAKANDPTSGKDRPEIDGHADEIRDYIEGRAKQGKPWVLGTLTANVDPAKIKIVDLGLGFCLVFIPPDVKLDLTDGQHRRKAIEQLIRSPNSSLIQNDYLPITVILESDFHQCQSDFRDLALAKPVSNSLLVSFKTDRGREGITNRLIDLVPLFRDKTDKFKKSPDKNSKFIYTSNYIVKMVSCAFTGNYNDKLENYDIEKSSLILADCLNQFFEQCEQTRQIYKFSIDQLTVGQIKAFKQQCLLGVSIGLDVLGGLLYLCYDPSKYYFSSDKISQLATIDWSRGNSLWYSNVLRIDPKNANAKKTYIAWGAASTSDAIKAVKDYLAWN